MKTVRILILEDDIETLAFITKRLYELEKELGELGKKLLSITILSEYTQVEKYINADKNLQYDILILDRDDKIGGSFHTINLGKFNLNHAISISSIPNYNEEAVKKGIRKVIWKDYQNLEQFSQDLARELKTIIEDI